MNITQPAQPVLLSFEFASTVNGEVEPMTFRSPVKVFCAYTIEEVVPCLEMVEQAIEGGYYAAGFLTYESAPAFHSAYQVHKSSKMPLAWFGIFEEPERQTRSSSGAYELSPWEPLTSTEEYNDAIESIKQSIATGHTYQTNYTIRLRSQFQGDDMAFFEKLKKGQASKYCAYVNTGEHSILSASPELFFQWEGSKVTTRPMKGTVKRGNSFNEDKANAEWLYHSEKNRAENIMIVDLLRNDLGSIAKSGTVTVPQLFDIERYPTVHQMTSTVTAEVEETVTLVDMFKALFPCGSITGAPKISTMGIIADLETAPREVYCGAIGYITPDRKATFNVPIRTVIIDQSTGEAEYGVGGGITWDSTSEGEYEEVLAKASLLGVERPDFQLLESLRLENGKYFLLGEHLHRLKNTAAYFGFRFDQERVNQALQNFADQRKDGTWKVRCLLAKAGEVIVEGAPIAPFEEPVQVILADEPLRKNNPFLYHKTTNREVYSQFQSRSAEHFDVLLWNEEGELTEFTNGNLVLEIDGELWTPPVSSGLLAGTFREVLIREGKVREKVLTAADLKRSEKAWFINSVRKWIQVQFT